MRVDIVTLTTASAAALTIGLASPALGATTQTAAGLHQMSRHSAYVAAGHEAPLHEGAHVLASLPKGDDDGDDGDDDGDIRQGHCDGGGCGGFFHRGFHCSGFRCGVPFHRGIGPIGLNPLTLGGGPFIFGGGCGPGPCGGAGGGGTVISSEEGYVAPSKRAPKARKRRPMVMPRRQVRMVPRGPAPTGFGGAQGTDVPLGIAGLALILGGIGLVPVARRRLRTSAQS